MTQQTWPQLIEQVGPKFNEIATQSNLVRWSEESQFAIQAIQKNDKLAQCMVNTVQNAIINVAAVGLTLNPALGYAYLVPESVKQGNGQYSQECMLRVSFKGLLKIATDSGSIKWAKAEIVKENDQFTYRGPCEMPVHNMQPFGDRGKTVGVYCIAKTHDGDILVDIMGIDEINKIRSAAKTSYVWNNWPDEMTKKAMIKRASKQWPKTDRSERLDLAVAAINEYEGSDDTQRQEKDVTPAAKEITKEQINDDRLEMAIEKINAGEYSLERLYERFALTQEQVARVRNETGQAEAVE